MAQDNRMSFGMKRSMTNNLNSSKNQLEKEDDQQSIRESEFSMQEQFDQHLIKVNSRKQPVIINEDDSVVMQSLGASNSALKPQKVIDIMEDLGRKQRELDEQKLKIQRERELMRAQASNALEKERVRHSEMKKKYDNCENLKL